MEKEGETKEKAKVRLGDFAENNQKLISVLGIFTALAAFANNIPIDFGYWLTFSCLGIAILLWIELIKRIPHWDRDDPPVALVMFHLLILMVLLIVAGYWLVQYRDFWRPFIPVSVMLILLVVIASPALKLKQRIERGNPFREFAGRHVRLIRFIPLIWVLCLLVLSCVLGAVFSFPLTRIMDWIDDSITKAEFAKNREKEFPVQFEFAPGKYCCFKAQAAGTTCLHTCCVIARINGTFCAKCVPKGSAVLKTNKDLPAASANLNQTGTNSTGTVTIAIDGADSEIFVDGSFVGNGSARVPLIQGKHVIEITKPGYRDYKREPSVFAGAELKLHPLLDRK